MSDEDRKAYIYRGYSDIVTFNEVIWDVERGMNAGKRDGSGETMPSPEGRDISGRYSVFTSFQNPHLQVPGLGKGRLIKPAHAPHHFQMNRRHCGGKIVDAAALGFTRQYTISYLHMSKYEGRISLQNNHDPVGDCDVRRRTG